MLDWLKTLVNYIRETMFMALNMIKSKNNDIDELEKMLEYSRDDGPLVLNNNSNTDDRLVVTQQAAKINRVYSDKDPKMLVYPKYSRLLYQQKLLDESNIEKAWDKNPFPSRYDEASLFKGKLMP